MTAIAARTGFIGLVTNVACSQAHPGALQTAENVVLRRVACVEPRDGTMEIETAGNTVVYGFSLDAENDIYCTYDGSTFAWHTVDGTNLQYDDPVSGVAVDPQPFRRDVWSRASARGNTYVPYEAGVLSVTDGGFSMAGLPLYAMIMSANVSTVGSWLANNEQVAYRAVVRRKDENGVIVRSLPTGQVVESNTTGVARSVGINLLFRHDSLGLFDAVEVYRTRSFPTSVTVDDEMQLVADIPASAFTLLSPFYIYVLEDVVSPTARGMTLYTSPSRGGIVQQNQRPPAAAVTAAYKGSLFFANVRGPQSKVVSFTWGEDRSGQATGIGFRTYTGDTTNGSNLITNMSSTVGLERGMILVGGLGFMYGTYITDISGTTLTMSDVSSVTAAGASIELYDAIGIDDVWVRATQPDLELMQRGTGAFQAYKTTPPKGGFNYTWNFETISRSSGSATIQATHGHEYDSIIPTYAEAALELDQDAWPGAICWSKKDEPEHVSPAAYAFVGDKAKAILGLVPTRDALFILKEDGVFRLTGAGATEGLAAPWRIDPYDPTTRCLLPSSVQPLNGRAYFLSNKGVVAFGDSGAEPVSLPIHDIVRDMIDEVQANFVSTGLYEQTFIIGSTAAVLERENEYTLLRGSNVDALVYNENTRAWTTWRGAPQEAFTLPLRALFSFEREGRVCYSRGEGHIYGTRLSTDAQLGALDLVARNDGETAVTATAYSGGFVTLSAPVTALKDDMVEDAAGKLWRVLVTVDPHNVLTVTGPDADFTTGSCVLYRSIRCRVAPQTFAHEPMLAKRHDKLTAMFSRLHGPLVLRYAYSSQLTPLDAGDWDEEDAVVLVSADGTAAYKAGYGYSAVIPDAHSRSWLLDAGVHWAMSHGTVRFEGLYVQSEPMKPGTRQQVAL